MNEESHEIAVEIEDKNCPICTDRALLEQCGGNLYWKYSCACGLTSKLFRDKWAAKEWFNTRAGKCAKKYKKPVIEVGSKTTEISGQKLVDGVIPRTPENMGAPHNPQPEIDQLSKDAEELVKTKEGSKVSFAAGEERDSPF